MSIRYKIALLFSFLVMIILALVAAYFLTLVFLNLSKVPETLPAPSRA